MRASPGVEDTRTCRDADDDNVLAARADLIVSGDNDLRVLRVFEGISIVNAADALALLDQAAQ